MSEINKLKFLLIDDEEKKRDEWERIITEYGDKSTMFQIIKEKNGKNTIELLNQNSDLKILFIDLFLGDDEVDGITIAKNIKENFSDVYVILVTAFGLVEGSENERKSEIIHALNQKHIDYFISKGNANFIDEMLKSRDAAIESLNNPLKRETYRAERIKTLDLIKDFIVEKTDDELISETLIGSSKAIQDLKKWIVKFAKANDPIPVLITGETGTGKEVVANIIHKLSTRKANRLVPVNCAAIPSELIESELLGHEKGSFTNAIGKHIGKFEQANNSTVFLDEIGDMTLSAQTKILRVLQEKVVTPVGSFKDIPVDVRVIAATNKDLKNIVEEEINNKKTEKFRHDLYYRLSGFHIKLKPLRERLEDIPDLVEYFTKNKNVRFTPKSINTLQSEYNWPGNIRELKSFIDNLSNLFKEKSPFEIKLVKEALELWKGMHPQTNYLFSNEDNNRNYTEKAEEKKIKKFNEYKTGELDEIEKRLWILIFAMKHDNDGNEINYNETDLNTLAKIGKIIHDNEEFRKRALQEMPPEKRSKISRGFSGNGSAISAWFSDQKEKIFAVIKNYDSQMASIKELSPFQTHIQPLM